MARVLVDVCGKDEFEVSTDNMLRTIGLAITNLAPIDGFENSVISYPIATLAVHRLSI